VAQKNEKAPGLLTWGFFICIWCPAPFEPRGEVRVFKGFGRLYLSKGYTASAAGVFSVGFSSAEKAFEVRCSAPDERYRHRDKAVTSAKVWPSPPFL
jgi:hypothetical protein